MAIMDYTGLVNCKVPTVINFSTSKITFTIYPLTGYYFPPGFKLEMFDYWYSTSNVGVVDSTGSSITVTNWTCDGDFSISGTALLKEVVVKKIPIIYTLNNVTSTNMNPTIDENTIFNTTINAPEGYVLNTPIELILDGGIVDFTTSNFYNDNASCDISYKVDGFWSSLEVVASATPKPKERLSSFSNIYNIDNENLNLLSKERFISIEDGSTPDLGQFITDLYILPFELPNDLKLGLENLRLGRYTTRVSVADKLNDYIVKYKVGEFNFKEVEFDRFISNSTTKIMLPFVENFEIETVLIVNKLVECFYIYDLITGTCNVIIKADDLLIHQSNVKNTIDIPVVQNSGQSVFGKNSKVVFNEINNMIIQIIQQDSYPDPKGYLVNEILNVVPGIGFTKLELINFNCDFITGLELEELERILKDGIIL
ncbi:MAG: hypothetical protein ACRC5T_03125 [Cetobacterium sp.]